MDNEVVAKRLAGFIAAWEKRSVDEILSFMADDVSVSDFGVNVVGLDKTATKALYTNALAAIENLTMTTRSINGDKNFTAWEWDGSFNYVQALPDLEGQAEFAPPMADGRLMHSKSASLIWWNDDGKMVKKHTYTKVIDQ